MWFNLFLLRRGPSLLWSYGNWIYLCDLIIQSDSGPSWSWSYGSGIFLCKSVQITTKVVSSNPDHTRYNIMWCSLSVTCGRSNIKHFITGLNNEDTHIFGMTSLQNTRPTFNKYILNRYFTFMLTGI
jgi:hypothetical protein